MISQENESNLFPLFVYGTLMSPYTQMHVFGRIEKGKTAFVSGFQKVGLLTRKPTNHGIYIAIRNYRSQIKGKVLLLTLQELLSCDEYESEGFTYVREFTLTQKNIGVFIYVENESYERYESRLYRSRLSG